MCIYIIHTYVYACVYIYVYVRQRAAQFTMYDQKSQQYSHDKSEHSSRKGKLYIKWQRCTGCLKLQVSFCTRATNYRALWRKIAYTEKASFESSPPTISVSTIVAQVSTVDSGARREQRVRCTVYDYLSSALNLPCTIAIMLTFENLLLQESADFWKRWRFKALIFFRVARRKRWNVFLLPKTCWLLELPFGADFWRWLLVLTWSADFLRDAWCSRQRKLTRYGVLVLRRSGATNVCCRVCCRVLQCVAVRVAVMMWLKRRSGTINVCCSVLQCVAVCCSACYSDDVIEKALRSDKCVLQCVRPVKETYILDFSFHVLSCAKSVKSNIHI